MCPRSDATAKEKKKRKKQRSIITYWGMFLYLANGMFSMPTLDVNKMYLP